MAEQNQQTHKDITLTPSGNVIIPENLKKKVKKPNSDKAPERKLRALKAFGKQESAENLVAKKKECLNEIISGAAKQEQEYNEIKDRRKRNSLKSKKETQNRVISPHPMPRMVGLTWFLKDVERPSLLQKYAKKGYTKHLIQLVEREDEKTRKNFINENDNINEQTALHLAAKGGFIHIVRYLVENGADTEIKDKIGRTAFLYAVRYNQMDTVKYFVSMKVDSCSVDCYGETALHLAVAQESLPMVKYLLENTPIDVNTLNTFKEAPLHKAARRGNLDISTLLLENQANPLIRGLQGQPTELVPESSAELKAFLEKYLKNNSINGEKNNLEEREDHYRWYDTRTKFLMILQDSLEKTSNQSRKYDESSSFETFSRFYDSWSTYPKNPKASDMGTLKRGSLISDPDEHIVIINGVDDTDFDFSISGLWTPYKDFYFKNVHLNFITKNLIPTKERELGILSVLSLPEEGYYPALLWYKWGFKQIQIPENELSNKYKELQDKFVHWLDKLPTIVNLVPENLSEDQLERGLLLVDSLGSTTTELKKRSSKKKSKQRHLFYYVTSKTFKTELLGVETKLARGKCYTIAVIYSKPGQTRIEDMLKNEPSSVFKRFMNVISDKINLQGWSGYRGGFNPRSENGISFYISWRGFEIMFHVATLLNAEQQRRLIGNDIAVIYFQEETSFQPKFLGNVNCIGVVVQPIAGSSYRLGCFSTENIKGFEPKFPIQPISDHILLKNLIISSCILGIESALKSEPYILLFAKAWQNALEESIHRHPRKKQK